jgi:diadenosine tetraphosphatase ApaH/serine/threonine PP2A family protein phosphatase
MGLIAIGDIHGCSESLKALLKKLAPARDDHLVFIGDYIDRGPDSRGVIDHLIRVRDEHECTFLKGNHEELFLAYLDDNAYDLWAINGGVATMSSYTDSKGNADISDNHVQFVRDTELFLETDEFFFVHAGLRPDLSVAENRDLADEQVFLWERSHLKADTLPWEKTVVCGHTPQREVINRSNLINIDTGCVFFSHPPLGYLTAVRLPEREFVCVPYLG